MEKNIIVTIRSYDNPFHYKESVDSIRWASYRWKSQYLELTQYISDNEKMLKLHPIYASRMWIYENFMNFDKVLVLDPDIIINSKSPSIFDELTDEYDFAAVLDANIKTRPHLKSIGDAMANSCVPYFKKYIPNFNEEKYFKNYFNCGVLLYRPRLMRNFFIDLRNLMEGNDEIIDALVGPEKNYGDSNIGQNIVSALLTTRKEKVKILDDTWNWIAPDIAEEYESMFLGPMVPNIYHFCGTNLSKERLKTYNRWR